MDKIKTQDDFVKSLRDLADAVERRGIVYVGWIAAFEGIQTPSKIVKTYRAGPRSKHTITIEWADCKHVEEAAGEKSEWRESQ